MGANIGPSGTPKVTVQHLLSLLQIRSLYLCLSFFFYLGRNHSKVINVATGHIMGYISTLSANTVNSFNPATVVTFAF